MTGGTIYDALAAFLAARRDEDEAVAKAASGSDWRQGGALWIARGHPSEVAMVRTDAGLVVAYDRSKSPTEDEAAHIARHDPARVLREVEADRKLLDLYERSKNYRDRVFARPEPRSISDEMRAVTQMMALEQVLKLRVAVYSDHPDYRAPDDPAP